MKNNKKINNFAPGFFVAVLAFGGGPLAYAAETHGSAGNYVVQLNAFTVESNASSFMEKWKTKGYPVFLDHEKGGRWFKIRIGPYGNWEEARQVSLNLKKKEKLSPLVLLTFEERKKPVEPSSLTLPNKTPESGITATEMSPSIKDPEETITGETDSVDRVVARFIEWKAAWQKKDFSTYLQFYSANFDPGSKSQQAWERSRSKALSRQGHILIDVAEVQILPGRGKVEMSFIQKFKSSRYSDVGHKTIVWRLENGDWHIISERWLPI